MTGSKPRRYTEPRNGGNDGFIQQLKTFCLCPDRETLDIKARQDIRDSITNHIRNSQLDFTHKTIKQGTPHTLCLQKTDASYHRALKTRAADKKLLQRLTYTASQISR